MINPIVAGNPNGKVLLIGECCGHEEMNQHRAFAGNSGFELHKMLGDAGIPLSDCYMTNVLHRIPKGGPEGYKTEYHFATSMKAAKEAGYPLVDGRYPDEEILEGREWVRQLVKDLKPNVVVPLGGHALWALTGYEGIMKWRGSEIEYEGQKYIPTNNPAAILNQWSLRWVSVQDLRRVARERAYPQVIHNDWTFHIRPTFKQVLEWLDVIEEDQEIVCDIETVCPWIACLGIAISKHEAMCIPFLSQDDPDGYWSLEEELAIVMKLQEVLTRAKVTFHNMLYDCQYIARNWGFVPRVAHDTMVMQHVCFPALRKALDFVASIVCEHYLYWKDDGKIWDLKLPQEQHWAYNCTDCVRTFEVKEEMTSTLNAYNLIHQYQMVMRLFWPIFKMLLRRIRVDLEFKNRLHGSLLKAQTSRSEWFEQILGHPLNPNSNPQMKDLFYYDLDVRQVIHRKRKTVTLDSNALETIKIREPLLEPLITTIDEWRSLRVFKSNYANAVVDHDGRISTSLNLTGTISFRFSSSHGAFNTGTNLQNISKGHEVE